VSGSRHRQRLEVFLAGIILLALAGSARTAAPWTAFGPGGGSVFSLAVDPGNAKVVYAVAGVRDQDATLYRSADGGLMWTALAGPGVATETSGQLGAVALDPADPLWVYYGGLWKVRRSLDGGVSWEDAGRPPGLLFISSLVAIPAAPPGPSPLLLLGFEGIAIYRSDDGAQTWTTAATLQAPAASPFEADKKAASGLWTFRGQPGRVYAAGSEGGLFVGRFE
jgi:hypothetical protein